MRVVQRSDMGLIFPVLFLVGIGIVMVYSASFALSLKAYGAGTHHLKRQAIFAMIGIALLVACRHFPYRYLRPLAYPLLLAAAAALLLALTTPLGITAGGATRWLRIGPLSFQPSEAARLALIIYLAYSLGRKKERIDEFSIGFVPHFLVLGLFVVLIGLEPDFGSIVILTALTWTMMFVGGVRLLHLLSPLPVVVAMLGLYMMQAPYRMQRLLSFSDPWAYAADQGYQVVHSQMAFGTGGIWGIGLGRGYQKLFFLPEPHTDFIFSVIGEELGLIGVLLILGLYLVLLGRGYQVARRCDDRFGTLLAAGLTTAIALQVCVNISVSLGLLPPKGLPLPFLSYGGTSLMINMASVGILMNISRTRVLERT